MIGEEMTEPMAEEFRSVLDEVNFGVSLEQALTNLAVRVPITDLRYFVVAVLIQRDSGGNLTEVLSSLARLIRQRLKLLGQVRVLSAEGRMSAWLLSLLPFGAAADDAADESASFYPCCTPTRAGARWWRWRRPDGLRRAGDTQYRPASASEEAAMTQMIHAGLGF